MWGVLWVASVLCFLTAARGQEHTSYQADLTGRWQLAATEIRGKFMNARNRDEWSFLTDSTYERLRSIKDDSTALWTEAGVWSYRAEDMTLLLNRVKRTGAAEAEHMSAERIEVTALGDANLVLRRSEDGMILLDHYVRIASGLTGEVKEETPAPQVPAGQLGGVCLISTSDPSRRVTVRPRGAVTLHSGGGDTLDHAFAGRIAAAGEEGFRFCRTAETLHWRSPDGSLNSRRTEWPEDAAACRMFSANEVTRLVYTSPTRRAMDGAGRVMMFSGAIMALLAAPLMALDFQGGMSGQQYLAVGSVGLGFMTLSLPLRLAGRGREFRLGEGPDDWKLRSAP
jgi:hypothetical protein